MKPYVKAALLGLMLPVAVVILFGIYVFEYMPATLQVIEVGLCIPLFGALFWFIYHYSKDRRARKQETMKQRIRQTTESTQLSDTPNPNGILYLRPFKVDDQYMSEVEYAGQLYDSIEAVFCRMLSDEGLPIAIGKPGEEVQPLGAHRFYTTDDQWKAKVLEYLKVSKLVILYADFTDGVKWELETTLSKYKDKLILIPKVYNRKGNFFRQVALLDPTFFLYPFYSLWFNHFFTKKGHRGKQYYQNWEALLKKHIPSVKMNDKVSAIIFENGKPVPFYTENPKMESQLSAIQNAIQTKLCKPKPQMLLRQRKEKPCLTISADLGVKNAQYAVFSPLVLGQLEFYEQGLRYRHWFGFLRFNVNIKDNYKTLAKYKKNQLIPYSSIRDVVFVKDNCLQLVIEEANSSLYLVVPVYHQDCLWHLKKLLSQCCDDGCFNRSTMYPLAQDCERQADDYARAFYLLEAVSLAVGVVLLILSLFGSASAYFLLAYYSGIWNIVIAMVSYCFSKNSRKKKTQLWGFVAVVLHVLLAGWFMA